MTAEHSKSRKVLRDIPTFTGYDNTNGRRERSNSDTSSKGRGTNYDSGGLKFPPKISNLENHGRRGKLGPVGIFGVDSLVNFINAWEKTWSRKGSKQSVFNEIYDKFCTEGNKENSRRKERRATPSVPSSERRGQKKELPAERNLEQKEGAHKGNNRLRRKKVSQNQQASGQEERTGEGNVAQINKL